MAQLLEPRCALVAACIATACSIYDTSLLPSGLTGGTAGQTGAGIGAAGGGGLAGAVTMGGAAAGDTMLGGAAGAGTSEGGEGPAHARVPYVTGFIGAPLISVGLTLDGTLDWVHWGLQNAADRNQKMIAVSQLLDFKPTGSVAPARLLNGPTTFVWSDGTPIKSASTKDGISWQGVGEGFQLALSAGADVRILKLYVGVFGGTGALKAALSDPRSVGSGDDRLTSDKPAWLLQVVTVEYGHADKPGTMLNVSWRVETASAANAAVSLTAMTIGNN